jgi:hypothetical protein
MGGAVRTGNVGSTVATIDGGSSGTSGTTITGFDGLNMTAIGQRVDSGPDAGFNGQIGLTVFIASAVALDWQTTFYRMVTDPDFYSVGTWVPAETDCASGSTGWVLFQAVAQTATAATDWANITDAIVDDANTADVTLDEITNVESEQLLFDDIDYGTTVPTTADSYTVSLRVKRTAQTNAAKEINDLLVKFIDDTGAQVGDNLADTGLQWPNTLTTKDYTVTGVTFDGSEFDADTGMAISATGTATNGNTLAEIAAVWIKIDWNCGDAQSRARGFFSLVP